MIRLEARPGTYALIFSSPGEATVQVGKLGAIRLRHGWYVYVGSALAEKTGVLRRVARHADLKRPKKWNVDYAKPHLRLLEVWFTHDPERRECRWADAVGTAPGAEVHLPRMGARDCKRCATHFYFFAARPALADFGRRLTALVPGHAELGRVVAATPEELVEQLAALVRNVSKATRVRQ